MEVLMYGDIWDYSAAEFVKTIEEGEDTTLTMRINCNGGSPESGWAMIAKFAEFDGEKSVKIDGKAYSMGAFAPLYVEKEKAQCLDVSQFLFHRAAYPEWFEDSSYFTPEIKANLANINKSLRQAFEARIDVAKFEEVSEVTVNEMFSMESRKDVFLNAQQAKKIGLVGKIIKITPEKKSSIAASMVKAAAHYTGQMPPIIPKAESEKPAIKVEHKIKSMTLAELQVSHPAIYAEAVAVGAANEVDRVGAYLVFIDVDAKAVKEGISSGKPLSATAQAEFAMKAYSPERLAALKAEADKTKDAGAAQETPAGATTEPTAAEKANAEVMAKLGINVDKK